MSRHSFTSSIAAIVLACVAAALSVAWAQAPPPAQTGVPVVVNGTELFRVRERLGPFTPSERAEAAAQRITDLGRNPFRRGERIFVVDIDTSTDVMADAQVLMSVTDADAKAYGLDRQQVAQTYADRINRTVADMRATYTVRSVLLGGILASFTTLLLLLLLLRANRYFSRLLARIEPGHRLVQAVRIQRLVLLSQEQTEDLIEAGIHSVRTVIFFLVLFLYFPLVFSFFPWTRWITRTLVAATIKPLATIWGNLVGMLPNLIFLVVLAILTWYAIRISRFFCREIEKKTIVISGFDPEWARPTHRIVVLMILATTVVAAFPYVPGSESPAFKGVSLFLGVLFSLASSSAISNVVSGVILTYTGAFRVGDRVKIGETTGDIVEKKLLVTEVRTIKNEDIAIPNSIVLNSHIINYSAFSKSRGLILHTSVTIGYDTPWRTVHKLLLNAAAATDGVLAAPAPFVLQTGLSDFYVCYEINAYTDQPNRMIEIYSALHQNIQDAFNEGGVEIMSPHYTSLRDGNQVTIPPAYRPKTYQPRTFRVAPPPDDPTEES